MDDYEYRGNDQGPYKMKKKRSPAFKFAMALLSVVAVVGILTTAAVLGYQHLMTGDETREEQTARLAAEKEITTSLKPNEVDIIQTVAPLPKRTNFAILVTDDDGQSHRTDAMMIGCYNTDSKSLDLISIPRDTYVEPSPDVKALMRKSAPSHMKLNAVYTYAYVDTSDENDNPEGEGVAVNEDTRARVTVKQLEEMFSIPIHYYVLVDLEAFQFIVDEIGGVAFDVPQRMYYVDPYENLSIDLQPGMQTLMGHDAMGLVRYRKSTGGVSKDYASADIQRMSVQQDFLKAAVAQALTSDNIVNNAYSMLEMVYKYVKSNMPVTDAVRYFEEAIGLSVDNIFTNTIPLQDNVGEYVYVDETEAYTLIQDIFFAD